MTTLNCEMSSLKFFQTTDRIVISVQHYAFFFNFDVQKELLYTQVVDLKDAKKQACLSLNTYLKDATTCLN